MTILAGFGALTATIMFTTKVAPAATRICDNVGPICPYRLNPDGSQECYTLSGACPITGENPGATFNRQRQTPLEAGNCVDSMYNNCDLGGPGEPGNIYCLNRMYFVSDALPDCDTETYRCSLYAIGPYCYH